MRLRTERGMKTITIVEIFAIVCCLIFGLLWIISPDKPYEPPFAVSGLVLVITEFYRRRQKDKAPPLLDAEEASGDENQSPADETIKGWSLSVSGGKKIKLTPGKRNVVDFGGGRKETYIILDNEIAAVEQVLENGAKTYIEINKNGDVVTEKLPFPLKEYKIDLNKDCVLSEVKADLGDGFTLHSYKLKWGNSASWVTNNFGELQHYYVKKGCKFDNLAKMLRVGY
jgi:hypothetical protein